MALHSQDFSQVPADTVAVARAVFPKGHPYLVLRDELGDIYTDEQFAPLFASTRGRPAESPGRLALVTVLQFVEDADDRQAADNVRARIDWKYLLALPLTDPGFDYSVLSTFRQRVLEGGAEAELLNVLLERLKVKGHLRKRGKQRTDSTHVLAAVRWLNRLMCVGETLRQALNSLAVVAPHWLREMVSEDWYDRYGQRFEYSRLPQNKSAQRELAETIGRDGWQVLQWCHDIDAPTWLRDIPAVEALRQIWVQQYYTEDSRLRWRTKEELPPHALCIVSPYDVEARYATKRNTHWTGYKVHLTETCEDDLPRLITNVETTPSTMPDHAVTATIHAHLQTQDLLPGTHLVDAGYVNADTLVQAQKHHKIELLGPVTPEHSWQVKAGQGFALNCFAIDWATQVVACPQGQQSTSWSAARSRHNQSVIHVTFPKAVCQSCPQRIACTRGQRRTLTFRPREQHSALQSRRQEQITPTFKERYKRRAGVEGTISQGTRSCGLRHSRYKGLDKNHLQHLATAAAINLMRLADWLLGFGPATTRCSRFAALASI